MELIIVMVILALLAAALLPSFLNFVRLAGERSLVAEARIGQVAAQVIMTETANDPAARAALTSNPNTYQPFIDLIASDTSGGSFGAIQINAIGRVTNIDYILDGSWVRLNDSGTTSGQGSPPPLTP